jgi:hypothetical protein
MSFQLTTSCDDSMMGASTVLCEFPAGEFLAIVMARLRGGR